MNEVNTEKPENRQHLLLIGQNINQLGLLLKTNLTTFQIKYIFSILLEILLFISFGGVLFFALTVLPEMALFKFAEETPFEGKVEFREIAEVLLALKIVIISLSIPLLLYALLLGRSRRKSKRIKEAFTELNKLSANFKQL